MALVDVLSATTTRLSTQWPLILSAFLVCAATWYLQVRLNDPYSKFPLVGAELGDEEKRRHAYMYGGAADLLARGFKQFKKGAFRITTNKKCPVIMVSPTFLPFLRELPDDVLSFTEAIDEIMHPEHTEIKSDRPVIPYIVKRDLTPHLARFNSVLAEEVDIAFRDEFPSSKEWTNMRLNEKLLRVVAKVSGRIFVGPDLCRDEEYLDMAINWTVDLMVAANTIDFVDVKHREKKAPTLPEVVSLHKRRRRGLELVMPLVQARRKAMKEDPNFERIEDTIQWVLEDGQKRYGEIDDQEVADIQLGLVFAAIHTTTMTMTNSFYTLAANPHYLLELREEVRSVLAEHGTFTTAALQQMKKLDSFLREIMRQYPLTVNAFSRKVLKPVTLPDGTELPAGCIIEVDALDAMNDPDVLENAETFDPWRHYRQREQLELTGSDKASASATGQFVSVSPTNLVFGYGRHACPGRFFAANEIKMILGRAVLDFDFKMLDPSAPRPKNRRFSVNNIPDPTLELLFKRISD